MPSRTSRDRPPFAMLLHRRAIRPGGQLILYTRCTRESRHSTGDFFTPATTIAASNVLVSSLSITNSYHEKETIEKAETRAARGRAGTERPSTGPRSGVGRMVGRLESRIGFGHWPGAPWRGHRLECASPAWGVGAQTVQLPLRES